MFMVTPFMLTEAELKTASPDGTGKAAVKVMLPISRYDNIIARWNGQY
jgi:hypothetical protein